MVSGFLQTSSSFGIGDSAVSKENGSQTIDKLLLQSERSVCYACTKGVDYSESSVDDFDCTRLLLPLSIGQQLRFGRTQIQ